MAYAKKDNDGVLFANRDRKSDRHPNAKGDALIDGVEYWVSAWTNTSKAGAKYQSLKFTRKETRGDASEREPRGKPLTGNDAHKPIGDEEIFF